MKALIRRLRSDASIRGGVDRFALEALANSLEEATRNMVESFTAENGVEGLRDMMALIGRIHAEYGRMKIKSPFHWDEPIKIPVRRRG